MTPEAVSLFLLTPTTLALGISFWRREHGWQSRFTEASSVSESLTSSLAEVESALAQSAEQRASLEIRLEEAIALAEEATRLATESRNQILDLPLPTDDSALRDHVASLADHLAGQVVTALGEAEQAVSEAIDAFSRISCEASEVAAGAQAMATSGGESGVNQVTERATTVMGGFVQGMLTTARQVSRSAGQIQSLAKVSEELWKLLDEVKSVADQTDLLSLNASLEAARAGQAGRGFSVVAGEVRKLSERSRKAADRMRSLTSQITSASGHVSKELGLSAERSLEESCQAQLEINHLLHLIQEGNDETQGAVSVLGDQSRQVSDDVGRIIIAFQFHDLLRQRLEHVAEPLCTLRDSLRGGDAAEVQTLAYAVGQNIFSAHAVGAAPDLEMVSYTADDDDSVTLF